MNTEREKMAVVPLEEIKCVILLDADLPLGLLANTAAVLSLSLGRFFQIVGEDIPDASGDVHAGLTVLPVPILKSSARDLMALRRTAAQTLDVTPIDVTNAAQTPKNYADYRAKLGSTSSDDLRYLGLALYGQKKVVNSLTGSLGLLR